MIIEHAQYRVQCGEVIRISLVRPREAPRWCAAPAVRDSGGRAASAVFPPAPHGRQAWRPAKKGQFSKRLELLIPRVLLLRFLRVPDVAAIHHQRYTVPSTVRADWAPSFNPASERNAPPFDARQGCALRMATCRSPGFPNNARQRRDDAASLFLLISLRAILSVLSLLSCVGGDALRAERVAATLRDRCSPYTAPIDCWKGNAGPVSIVCRLRVRKSFQFLAAKPGYRVIRRKGGWRGGCIVDVNAHAVFEPGRFPLPFWKFVDFPPRLHLALEISSRPFSRKLDPPNGERAGVFPPLLLRCES
ncbi:hypothetical protein HPB51_017395 [Rhipicephalus microplus]|uniref:Uncharacterized protein n=1 Tax=Rhipicephalus microplus TaxID=6941 RepID=A0A9J6DAV3_RHIMP|nr:hypothetical protein HPB51_017395 [Rhipicephalus microplus]